MKELIIDKIKKIADWFVNEYNKTSHEMEDVNQLFTFYQNDIRAVKVAEKYIKIDNLKSYSTIKLVEPKLKGVEILNVHNVFLNRGALLQEYKKVLNFYRRRVTENIYNDDVKYGDLEDCYLISESFIKSGKKARYFKDVVVKQRYTQYYLIRRKKPFRLFKSDDDHLSLYRLLGLRLIPRDKWRAAIKEFYMMRDQIVNTLPKYDDYVPTQAWLDTYYPKAAKDGTRKVKPKGTITLKIGSPLEKYTGNNCKFVSTNYLLQDIHKNKGLIVVSKDADSNKLDNLYPLLKNVNFKYGEKHQVAIVSDREYDNINKYEIHNLITLEKFMEGDCTPFRRIVISTVISGLCRTYRHCFLRLELFKKILPEFHADILELHNYKEKYYSNTGIRHEILEVANSKNLWDEPIYTKYLKIKEFLEAHPLLNYFADRSNDNMTKVALTDYLLHHKIKMSLDNYKQKI